MQQLAAQGVQWHDDAIPGGGGGAAIKVLTGRVLAGEAPDVAQVIGRTLTDWAGLAWCDRSTTSRSAGTGARRCSRWCCRRSAAAAA